MSVCSFEGCDRANYAKGYCRTHYQQLSRGVTLAPVGPPVKCCSVEGCNRIHLAGGLCKAHYYAKKRADGYRDPTRLKQCKACGEDFQSRDHKHVYCSEECSSAAFSANGRNWTEAKETARLAKLDRKTNWPQCKLYHLVCSVCEQPFVSRLKRSTCSKSCGQEAKRIAVRKSTGLCLDCGADIPLPDHRGNISFRCPSCRHERFRNQRRAGKQKRRAWTKGAEAEKIISVEIFERDEWRCGICGHSVDATLEYPHRMSASLDHRVPLVRGGAHSPANVQCAHLQCNMDKGARLAASPGGYGVSALAACG